MKAISLEKRHLRHAAMRKLTTASCIGGFITFTFGAWIAPWIKAVAPWIIHQLPWWHHAGPLPDLLFFVAHPDMRLGFLWLGYYVVTYLLAIVTLSPRKKQAIQAQLARQYRERYGSEWSFPHYSSYSSSHDTYSNPRRPRKEEIPLSQVWPGELKHQLVERCYAEYRKALQRFDPVPIDLKTPAIFFYRKGGPLGWEGKTLVFPEEMLTPQRIGEVMPFLAHHLYDHNEEHFTQEETDGFPDHVPLSWLLFFTGNFLWLPVIYKHSIEEQVVLDSVAQQKQKVLDRDEFAVLLGQGPALEHQLRRMEEEIKNRNEIDMSIPTLIERIGRLEVLNAGERQQMRKLGLKPKEPPLAPPQQPQLGPP